MTTWVGIDISKDSFDVAWYGPKREKLKHLKFDNDEGGFQAFLANVPDDAAFVMEATGSYYINLALLLHEQERLVVVVNPLRIKKHIQADLSRNKSDKADAYAIARFGMEKQLHPWRPLTKDVAEMQQLRALADLYARQITQLSNQKHAFSQSKLACKEAISIIELGIKLEQRLLEETKKELEAVAARAFPRQLELMTTIPGIGIDTAIRLQAIVGDFSRFESGRQLVSFLGISPTLKQSGTSVHSKGRISRMGNPHARKTLYMCAVSAARYNASCKDMWERMKTKGKPTRLVFMAIANKLLRQIHALIRYDVPYDHNFALSVVAGNTV